jgi:tetratricopeptide (TPR) repeat protein
MPARVRRTQQRSSELVARGHRAHARGDLGEAERLYAAALQQDPESFDALHLLGFLAYQRGDPDRAVALIGAALERNGASADALFNLGLALHAKARYAEALASYDRAARISPHNPELLNSRGAALLELQRPADALASFERGLAIAPGDVETLGNRGNALLRLNRLDAALASYDTALGHAPGHVRILTHRAHALRRLGRIDEAVASTARALAASPDFAEARFEHGLGKLTLGEFHAGWRGYEWRWCTAAFAPQRRNFGVPRWLGDAALDGRTILLHAEQGFGDTIQFARYVPLVAALGAEVVLEVQPELEALMSRLPGVDTVVTRGEALPRFDLHCPLMSLPLAFRTDAGSIPSTVPYVVAPDERRAIWERRLSATRPRIGLIWAGSRSHLNDRNRSMRLSSLVPLLELADVQVVCLQREVIGEDAAVLAAHPHVARVGEDLRDFDDTAAVLSLMDLVISVDTAAAHLAGALGTPLWLLLPLGPDFRWMREREDSPWYPTARLFRQRAFDDWSDVVGMVRERLHGRFGPGLVHRASSTTFW